MLIAERNALLGEPPYTAKSYVQDGLVAMWDGIENAGWGKHDANATGWKDLVGTRDFSLVANKAYFEDNAFYSNITTESQDYSAIVDWTSPPTVNSLEICFMAVSYPYKTEAILLNNNCGTATGTDSITMPFFACGWHSWVLGNAYFGTGPSGCVEPGVGCSFSCGRTKTSVFVNNNPYSYNSNKALYIFGISNKLLIGNRTYYGSRSFHGRIYSIRLYSRALSASEIAANYAIDKERFNLP